MDQQGKRIGETGTTEEACASYSTESSLLAAALAALPGVEATVLRLHHESCLPFEEIARMMGIDLKDVRTAWVRGLRGLQRHCCIDLGECRSNAACFNIPSADAGTKCEGRKETI